jgi:type IV pilus assembly protein PilY1
MKTSIRTLALALAASAAASTAHGAGLTLGTTPLYLGSSVAPLVMLTVSRDEQLFHKLYNDYTDLDGDGLLDITYKHTINYYGYFDSFKCYNYDTVNSRFVPAAISPAANKYCDTVAAGRWSGNFLNWATMTRADAVRKILYGGHRSTDTAALTVLERAQIPFDSHSFSKYYHGADINRLTPFAPPVVPASGAASGSDAAFTANAAQSIAAGAKNFRNAAISVCKGDQLRVNLGTATSTNFVMGYVSAVNPAADCSPAGSGGFTIQVKPQGVAGSGAGNSGANAYTVTNMSSTGITICNVTDAGSTNLSHTTANPPLIKVAQGNFAMWANNDIVNCQWNPANNTRVFGGTGSNGNEGSLSGGLPTVFPVGGVNWASALEPIQARHGLSVGGVFNLVARVEACRTGVLGFERCKAYGTSPVVYKPIGLLQFYGEPDLIYFGLMTGSYQKNKSGGVLRKNAGSFTNEVNPATGQFLVPATGGIVDTLNRLRIYGWDYATTSYGGAAPDRDGCPVITATTGTATLNRGDAQEGICTSWGNPVAESYLEMLRYLAGKTPDAAFGYAAGSKDDQVGGAPGLPKPAWVDPMSDTTRYCRPLNALVFSANVSSFDNDQLANITQLNTGSSAVTLTNTVGTAEGINGNNFFVGNDGAGNNNELCTLKNGISLGSVFGVCPESPRGRGSYLISGIAHHAHTNRIRVAPDPTALAAPPTNLKALKVNTYGVTLAANSGTVQIPVGTNTVTLLPIARVQDIVLGAQVPPSAGSGGLIDFKVIQQTATSGKFFVQWEVSQQGADRDLDLWGVISYTIAGNNITVTTDVISANPSGFLGFGYVIAGTNQDGAHFHSGYNTFNYTYNPGAIVECASCQTADAPSSKTYTVTGSTAQILKDPLFYAAKYGGFNDVNANNMPDQAIEWDSKKIDGSDGADGIPDTYFPVTNPAALEAALDRAFIYILEVSSASSVATNSTSLTTGSRVYQARFNSNQWSGQLLSFTIQSSGVIDPVPNFDAGQLLPQSNARIITTYSPRSGAPGVSNLPAGVPFRWGTITPEQQTELRKDGGSQVVDSLAGGACASDNLPAGCTDRGPLRLEWLRGNSIAEGTTASAFRVRPSTKLADIVNSTPRFVGPPSLSFTDPSYLAFRSTYAGRTPMLYVGSNGGMFHAFEATSGSSGGIERFAYVPGKLYPNLTRLTTKPYSHRYFVDGTPSVNDACFGSCAAASDWKTVAVGGYNAGGQGYYALDVTDPNQWGTEATAAAAVLWEFTDVNDPDLGYSYSKPLIVKMSNGRWAAVFGNGYNNSVAEAGELACDLGSGTPADPYRRSDAQPGCSTSLTGYGYLFILFLDGGVDGVWTQGIDYIKVSTNTGTDVVATSNPTPGTPNGIATPVAIDTNGDGMVDFVYAGDLVGNLWKFDVTSALPAAWTVASAGAPLFIAQDASGNRQRITSAPVLFPHPGGGFMVLFGTGKYIEITDDTGPFTQNAFYGIWDKIDNTTVSRSDLMQQKVLNVSGANLDGGIVVFGSTKVRLTSAYVPNYSATDRVNAPGTFGDADVDPEFVAPTGTTPANQRGWLLEMPNSGNGGAPNAPATGTGEKIVFDPIIANTKLVFTTLLPSTQPCDAGGTSYLMDMDPVSGSRLSFSPFDLNNDNNFSSADFVTFAGKTIAVAGLGSTIGIVPQPTVIQGTTASGTPMEVKVLSGSSGGLQSVKENPGGPGGPSGPGGGSRTGKRITWRELLSN